jgi:hypothetical protein
LRNQNDIAEIPILLHRACLGILAALCLAASASAQTAPQARIAGKIELAEGVSRVEGKDKRMRRPAVGENVLEGDTISTLSNSEVHLAMSDGASLIVRERTRIRITEYVADGNDKDRSVIDLAEGALRAITGWIGAYNRSNYRVRTPLVTIGVRGTDHEPTHLLEGDPRGKPGSYDKVNEGTAFMESKQGSVEVPANTAVFQALAAEGIPQLLATIPGFFKPGRFDNEFMRRAQDLKNAIPQKRLDRIEFLRKQGLVPQEAQNTLDQAKSLEQKGKELLRWLR